MTRTTASVQRLPELSSKNAPRMKYARNGWRWSTDCRTSWIEGVRQTAKKGSSFGPTNSRCIAATHRFVTEQPGGRSAHTVCRWLRRSPISRWRSWCKMTGLMMLTLICFLNDQKLWIVIIGLQIFGIHARERDSGRSTSVCSALHVHIHRQHFEICKPEANHSDFFSP